MLTVRDLLNEHFAASSKLAIRAFSRESFISEVLMFLAVAIIKNPPCRWFPAAEASWHFLPGEVYSRGQIRRHPPADPVSLSLRLAGVFLTCMIHSRPPVPILSPIFAMLVCQPQINTSRKSSHLFQKGKRFQTSGDGGSGWHMAANMPGVRNTLFCRIKIFYWFSWPSDCWRLADLFFRHPCFSLAAFRQIQGSVFDSWGLASLSMLPRSDKPFSHCLL